MQLQRFDVNYHYNVMKKWLEYRGLRIPPIDEMPEIGVVACNVAIPIAMAFLRRVEGGFGQIDSFVTNPECSKELRDTAATIVNQAILDKAKELNLKAIISYTQDTNTLIRAQKLGFSLLNHIVIVHNLGHNNINEGRSTSFEILKE